MPLIVKLLKRQISKQLSYGYDVGRGYVAGEEEVRKLIDHMVDQKDIAKNLKQSSDNGRLDVIRCLGKWTVNQMDVIHRHGKWNVTEQTSVRGCLDVIQCLGQFT